MRKIISFLLLLIGLNCFSQFSKTHYIPPLSNSDAQAPQGQYLYISSPSITPVNFKIIELGGGVINGTVTRDVPYIHNIGFGFNTQLMISRSDVNNIKSNKGFIVEAEDLVYVNVRLTTTPNQFQAGGIVSKGLAALGKEFRVGAFLNKEILQTDENHYTFVSVLATENNTTVTFSDIKTGVTLINNVIAGNNPQPIILNRGQSFAMAVQGPGFANRDGLIGSLVKSDKPIAVNCGSIAGTNGDASNLDLGFDQIVPAEIVGKEYIFVKGNGVDVIERPLLVIHHPNTDVYINGDTTPFNSTPLQPGHYLAFDGTNFTANGSLYVRTTENVFAYQSIGGTAVQANQNMCFVPPLSCSTPNNIDNIPRINEVGSSTNFDGTVNVVTKTGASLDFIINGTSYALTALPAGITVIGPINVIGNPDYVTYTFVGLTGNISLYSTKQVYLSYFGTSGAATYGGYYSGFTFDPEVAFNPVASGAANCIPNVELSVNALTAYDDFQWFFNGNPIPGATARTYIPSATPSGFGPGLYYVKAKILECGIERFSDTIPVSSCAPDSDNDSVNDNIDLDLDNDGIANCNESHGNAIVDLSASGNTVSIQNYSNTFTTATTGTGTQTAQPFTGTADGTFVSTTAAGLNNSVSTTVTFTQPINLLLEYASVAAPENLLSSEGEFIIQVPVDKTITVLNPDDQLLIDTNYDGIFESGITEYTSFEIRFRLKSAGLSAGAGTFEFRAYQVTSLKYTHKNLSDDNDNNATFKLIASCVKKDTDGDGIFDDVDFDSDNDGIPDNVEVLGANFAPITFTDNNKDGMHDAFEALPFLDTDLDGIADYLDLDSDNDGIYDLVESGSGAIDANHDGRIDGLPASFGQNGLHNSLETSPDSGVLNFAVAESDGVDSIQNYIDLDSDNDGCLDVTEANFSDADNDGKLGNAPNTVDTNGVVTSAADGYTVLASNNYVIGAPIIIVTQPQDKTECERTTVTFTINANSDSFQWQFSTDGVSYANITNNGQYAGSSTHTLQISNITSIQNGYKFRVVLNRVGNSCVINSDAATLTVKPRPLVAATITLKQCDDDTDGFSDFNLTQLESLISANAVNEVFTYFRTFAAADTADAAFQITSTSDYNNTAGNTVWVRVSNPNGCYDVTRMNLVVVITQIPPGFSRTFARCDDFLDANGINSPNNDDRDGISGFDFSSVTSDISAILGGSPNYTINYYQNEADALAETNPISNSANYRNISSPGQQIIWVRVENDTDNSCFGLGPYVTLTVEALPIANPVIIARQCDQNPNDAVVDYPFDTSGIQALILNGQTNVTVSYTDQNGNILPSPLPNPFTTQTQTVTARVTNNATANPGGACYEETLLNFIVNRQPFIANPITVTPLCDDLPDNRDGQSSFDTSMIESQLLGSQTGYSVRYMAQNGAVLSSPLPNPFVTASQTVTAILENPVSPNCSASATINFRVNPLPDLDDVNNNESPICINIAQTVKLDAGLQSGSRFNYSYEWSRNNTVIPGETNYMLVVNQDGTYTVKVTDKATGCSRIRTHIVFKSEIAAITDIDVADLLENNTVNIITTGSGKYEYSIDNPDGPFQQSPLFENIEPGLHTVYVHDIYGCGIVSKLISVVGAPLFFTPNGDSYNDYWKISGVNPMFYPNSIVYIFDRYGKLLKEIPNGNDIGWDGTFKGQPLPGDDYWYVLKLQDGRVARGHFALKR